MDIQDVYFGAIAEGDYPAWVKYLGYNDTTYARNRAAQDQGLFGKWLRAAQREPAKYYLFIVTPKMQVMWEYCWNKYNMEKDLVWKTTTPAHNYLYRGDGPKLHCFIFKIGVDQ